MGAATPQNSFQVLNLLITSPEDLMKTWCLDGPGDSGKTGYIANGAGFAPLPTGVKQLAYKSRTGHNPSPRYMHGRMILHAHSNAYILTATWQHCCKSFTRRLLSCGMYTAVNHSSWLIFSKTTEELQRHEGLFVVA